MAKENIQDKIDKVKDMGGTVYSISRLNTYNDCQYGYYRNYVLKDKGEDNIYAVLGGNIHDRLENVCNNIITLDDLKCGFEEDLENATLFMSFPSEKVQQSWENDMRAFVNDFQPLQYDNIQTEKGFVTKINDVWMQGFIDVIGFDEEGIDILDWKTSSAFKGDKLTHAGRQLVIYKLAVEEMLKKPVRRTGWYMLKYVDVYFDGKIKQCNRGSWVKDRSGVIKTQLKKLGYQNYEDMIEVAIHNNNLKNMPKEVQDRFVLKPSIVWYDVTDELIDETKKYIKNTVLEIENKDTENSRVWECKNIYKDKGFFCQHLCGHSKSCKLFQWYLDNKDN